MKKFVLFGLVVFSGVLAACSQDSEASLESLGYGEVSVVTDIEGLSEPLSQVLDARFAPTVELAGAAAEYGAGVVSYDITPDLVWPPPIWIDPEEFDKEIKRIRNQCQLIPCDEDGNPEPDPRTGALSVGFDFTAVYATPELLERVADFGYSEHYLSQIGGDTLSQIVAEANLGVAKVGKYIPGGPWDSFCQQRPVPEICKYISVGSGLEVETLDIHDLNKHVNDFGLIIVDYGDLRHLDLAGELVQLHGEGLQPLVSPLQVSVPEHVGEEAALHLLERLYSDEGQYALAEAGVVPVSQHAYNDVMTDDVAGHVESAFRHGQLSASSEPF